MESMGRDGVTPYDPEDQHCPGAGARRLRSNRRSPIPVGNGTFVSLEGLLYDSLLSPDLAEPLRA